jgi:bis(5'-nucleosyl)-tetraphosphatase (symmetrical)
MTTYVAGDIQGCLKSLTRLMKKVNFDPAKDQLWSVGDIVNRGPKSLETLRFLKSLGERFQMVLGNHDLHLIALAYGVIPCKKGDTLNAVLSAPDRQELIDWLRQQPLIFKNDHHVLVHAGIPHLWTIAHAMELAHEVESVLQSADPAPFLREMYGNEPACWSDELTGNVRLRVITNYLTRMRCCKADGTLDLVFKGAANEAPKGFSAWFDHHLPLKKQNEHVFFGHWAALKSDSYHERFHALDSGCIWGGKLTFFAIEENKRITTECA